MKLGFKMLGRTDRAGETLIDFVFSFILPVVGGSVAGTIAYRSGASVVGVIVVGLVGAFALQWGVALALMAAAKGIEWFGKDRDPPGPPA